MQGSEAGPVPEPPVAKPEPTRLEVHGHVRVDDYHWLRDPGNPEVLEHLRRENDYREAALVHLSSLREKLFAEIVGRLAQDDATVPYRLDDFHYHVRFEEGKEYPVYCRRRDAADAIEEVILDVNELASGHDYFSVRGVTVSPRHDVLVYAADTVGRREYVLHFRHLARSEVLDDAIAGVTGNVVWAADNETVFYAVQHTTTLRSHRIYRHRLGDDPSRDVLVHDEADEEFSVHVTRTKSRRYLLIESRHTSRSEVRYLAADEPAGEWRVILARQGKHEYSVDHDGRRWLIRSNDGAANFRLLTAAEDAIAVRERWTEVLAPREDTYIAAFEPFRDFLTVLERRGGLTHLRVISADRSGGDYYIDPGESAYTLSLGTNAMLDSDTLRYTYTSLTTPISTFDHHVPTRSAELRKREPVHGGDFDPANYVTERLQVPARDGTLVPVSLVHRRGVAPDGKNPLLLYGYGSYGITMDPAFSAARLSLVDRGFVWAIAHVRGGQINGRPWYEDGKLLRKKNTFTDFIDVAEFLVATGHAAPDLLFGEGHSAGGLLIGAVVNMRPDLFRGVIAGVPFVDVVTTMLDDSMPLTTGEYDEWGNPQQREFYDYILSYSPYDNVAAHDYPAILAVTGLHDTQVHYWEPAKWVAKLRARKTGGNPVYLSVNMGAGHGGASGRFERYRDIALQYAFLLDLAGIRD